MSTVEYPRPGADVAGVSPNPGTDVAGASPNPGADVAGVSPNPGAGVAGVSPNPGADVVAHRHALALLSTAWMLRSRSGHRCMLRSVAFDCLTAAFKGENEDYYHNTAAWVDLDESCLLGEPCTLHSFDLYTVKTAEIKELQALPWYCESTVVPWYRGW